MAAGGVSKNGVGKLIFCIGNIDSYAYKQAIQYYLNDIKILSKMKNNYFSNKIMPLHIHQKK